MSPIGKQSRKLPKNSHPGSARRQSRHVQGRVEHSIANFGDLHGPVERDSRLMLLGIQTRIGSDRSAGAKDIGTRQFGQNDASQDFSHAVDADQ
jgi:hypothetical protein